jgi:mono/diheme cytochrome c family protein
MSKITIALAGVLLASCVAAPAPPETHDGAKPAASPEAAPMPAVAPAPAAPVASAAAAIPAPAALPVSSGPPWPLDDPEHIEKGKIRFGANCAAYCHGFEGSGGKTPAFRGRKDLVAEQVFKVITEGRVGSAVMPAWGKGFSDEKRWELVAYIMWLSRQEPRPPQ